MDMERLKRANKLSAKIHTAEIELKRWEEMKDFSFLKRANTDINGKKIGTAGDFELIVSDGIFQEFKLRAMAEIQAYLNKLKAEFESI